VLQRVAVCCSVLQCVAACCSVLQRVAVCCSVLQRVAVCCSVLQRVAVCYSVLQCVAQGFHAFKPPLSTKSTRSRQAHSPLVYKLYTRKLTCIQVSFVVYKEVSFRVYK